MVKLDDFRGEDGQVDWRSYRQAQVDIGEICYKCGGFILIPAGHMIRCISCQDVDKPNELSHEKFIRCPACEETFDPFESEYYELAGDGEHDVSCPSCHHDFEITTDVRYTFISPPLKDGENVN